MKPAAVVPEETVFVVDKLGQRGLVDLSQFTQNNPSNVLVRFGDEVVLTPVALLVAQEDGSFYLPVARSELKAGIEEATNTIRLPIVAEQLHIQKRKVETGGVRVAKQVHEKIETIDLPLFSEEVEVRRIEVNRRIDEPLPVRQEGDTLIVPVLEEVLVLQKQLFLKEEVHITTRRTERRHVGQETVRNEEVMIEPLSDG